MVCAVLVVGSAVSLIGQAAPGSVKTKLVVLDPTGSADTRVLGGPPETMSMRSGAVVLLPGKSVGTHSTDDYEEAVIVLAGTGEIRITGGTILKLKASSVAYCPPGTAHDVVNTGKEPLRYVYVVAKAILAASAKR